jgi:hypothetical protein
MRTENSIKNSIKIIKIFPDICKHSSCLNRAMYEFTNTKGSDEYKKTITIGHSCENHVEEVNKLLTNIYRKDKDRDDECFFI